MTLGHRIRTAREAAGLTPAQLAERLGIKISRLCEVETGYKGEPTLNWVIRAADAIGCPRSQLDPRLADRAD